MIMEFESTGLFIKRARIQGRCVRKKIKCFESLELQALKVI